MTGKFYQRKYAPQSKAFTGRPDCTPFLDVFFLLLIFLVLSLPFVQLSGVEVTLPQVGAAVVRPGLERFIITITHAQDGSHQIYFNDKPLTLDQLAEELSQVSLQTDMKMVIVRADVQSSHDMVTKVISTAARFELSTFLATGLPGQGGNGSQGNFAPAD